MLNSEADGFIILGTELNYADVARLEKLEKPMVIIDTYFDFLNCTFVDMNNVDSVFRIVSHFMQNGHASIGFLTSPSDVNNFRHRESGFRDAMHHFGLSCREDFIYSVDSTFDGACRDMLAILESDPPFPTALFACNDIIAYGCIKALKEKGLSVPDDISIIGFDDLPMSSVMEPPLTTIQVSKERIGATAVQLISMMLDNGQGMPPSKITISGELIIRDSVRKLDAAEPVPELLTPQG
jgi:LacI family transcriptional regulator